MVDASVAFKWLIPDAAEEDVPAAKALLVEHLEGRVRISIPLLLYYEVGNILLFGRPRPSIEAAVERLTDLFSMPLNVVLPDANGASAALRVASLCGLSNYDAAYVALAQSFDCPLITADRLLARRASAVGHVRLLSDRA